MKQLREAAVSKLLLINNVSYAPISTPLLIVSDTRLYVRWQFFSFKCHSKPRKTGMVVSGRSSDVKTDLLLRPQTEAAEKSQIVKINLLDAVRYLTTGGQSKPLYNKRCELEDMNFNNVKSV